ncbi:hypothetical protein FEM08_30010 [Flavobacterium gilvum]|nr:hypothetical protein FEM08_30010 [Flavobacterium gilvum]
MVKFQQSKKSVPISFIRSIRDPSSAFRLHSGQALRKLIGD